MRSGDSGPDFSMKPAASGQNANRYEVVSRLADDLAHEIKNPLNAIVVNLEVLRRKVETGARETALERASVIDFELNRVHGLIDQLLQLVRPPRPEVGAISIDELLSDLRPLLDLQARAARAEFELASEGDLYARMASDALKFAILNLVTAVYAAAPEVRLIRVGAVREDGDVVISVHCPEVLFRADGNFEEHARSLMTDAGGGMEIRETAATGAGSTAVLRIPACSSFA